MKKRTKIIVAASALCCAIVIGLISLFSLFFAVEKDENLAGADRAPGYSGSAEIGSTSPTDSSGKIELEDRKIIKNVNETVQTDDYEGFIKSLMVAIDEVGGIVTNRRETGSSYDERDANRSAYLEVRVPADRLSDFTSRVDEGAVVTSYNESAVDVTGAYIDARSRIAVLEAEEEALLEMLSKSTTVDTALKVRERLLSVQSELASLRAQKENYDSRIAYSTVYLNVYEVRRAVEGDVGFFEEVGARFSDSLYGIGSGLRSFGVFVFGDFLYILLVIALLVAIFVLLRRYRKFRALHRAERDPDSDEQKPDSDEKENK